MVAAMAVWTASGQGTFEAVEDYDPNNLTPAFFDGTVGAAFGVTNNVTVTALGCFDYLLGPGQGAVQVGLWNSSGSLLASNTITTSSTLFNQSRYQAVTPVFLAPNQTYFLGRSRPTEPGAVSTLRRRHSGGPL